MNLLPVIVVVIGLCLHNISCEDDDMIKGPLMPMCDGKLCTTEQIIHARGLKGETHKVTSEDGYKITIFRVVPRKQNAKPVILQHGFLCSSDCWLSDNRSIAIRLQEAGYDVWLTNMRGNCYGRDHTKLKPDEDEKFWDFSFHEMAVIDLPVMVDYILKTTNQPKVDYIGHSLGTTIGLVLLSQRPEYNPKVSSIVLLGPVVYLSKMKDMLGPDGMAEEMANKYMVEFIEGKKLEMFPRNDTKANEKTQVSCINVEDNFREMCKDGMKTGTKTLGGPYIPAGQSFKNARHLYQCGVYGEMRKFNGTPEENQKAYSSLEPPKYSDKFGDIKSPVILMTAEEDDVINMDEDLPALVSKLPSVKENKIIKVEGFNHMAYVVPMQKSLMSVRDKLNDDIISFLQKYGV